jgi:hypothetical protein
VAGRLPAGEYRVVVHNWAGGPQQVDLKFTFYNTNNQAGPEGGSGGSASTTWVVTNEVYGGLPLP